MLKSWLSSGEGWQPMLKKTDKQDSKRGARPCSRQTANRTAHWRSNRTAHWRSPGQEGMALIGVLLIMSLVLMLGLAVTFTALSDKSITSNFKNLTSGFYVAEAGINNLHRMLRNDKFIMGSIPDPPQISPGRPTLNPDAFVKQAEQLFDRKEQFPNDSAYHTKIKIETIQVPFSADDSD